MEIQKSFPYNYYNIISHNQVENFFILKMVKMLAYNANKRDILPIELLAIATQHEKTGLIVI